MQLLKVSIVICFLLSICCGDIAPNHGKLVFCYIRTWAMHRPGRGEFNIEDINPTLCTHLVYAFSGLNETTDSIQPADNWRDLVENYGKGGYSRFAKLKENHPHLTLLLAIGGWNEGSKKYSAMVGNQQKRNRFVKSVPGFLKKHNFDGLVFNWLHPSKRGGIPQDKENLVVLFKELKSSFKKDKLLLSVALAGSKDIIDNGYDIAGLNVYLDYFLVECYDYYGPWDGVTGPNAPLRGRNENTVEKSVNYMLRLGADRSKLILGIPLSGRTFLTTQKSSSPTLGVAANTVGFSGPYVQEDGFMAYNEICLELKNTSVKWSKYWDDDTRTPFAIADEKVISYDDPRSIMEKVRFAMGKNLAGCMTYSLDTDDFRGDCSVNVDGFDDYPLMRSINKYIYQSLKDIERDNEIKDPDERSRSSCFKAFMTCSMKRCYNV